MDPAKVGDCFEPVMDEANDLHAPQTPQLSVQEQTFFLRVIDDQGS
jgi:hypothetical protein